LPVTVDKEDRRTKRTRHTLVGALLGLIEAKPYDFITVQDIITAANVGRSTFYAHYRNKDDLLLGGFEHLLDVLVQQIVIGRGDELSFDTTILFCHAQGHHEIYRRLIWGSGFKLLIKDSHAVLSRKVEERLSSLLSPDRVTTIPLSLLAYALSGSLLMLVMWWLDRRMPCTPERMEEIFQQLTMPGIRAALQGNCRPFPAPDSMPE
jgi:AcrR family transcriptional regulator